MEIDGLPTHAKKLYKINLIFKTILGTFFFLGLSYLPQNLPRMHMTIPGKVELDWYISGLQDLFENSKSLHALEEPLLQMRAISLEIFRYKHTYIHRYTWIDRRIVSFMLD